MAVLFRFPAGWCQLVGYPLEAPKDEDSANSSSTTINSSFNEQPKKKRYTMYRGRRKRRRTAHNAANNNTEPMETEDGPDDQDEEGSAATSPEVSAMQQMPKLIAQVKEEAVPSTSSPHNVKSTSELSNSSVVVKASPHQSIRSTNPRDWSVEQVVEFLKELSCENYASTFVKEVSCVVAGVIS